MRPPVVKSAPVSTKTLALVPAAVELAISIPARVLPEELLLNVTLAGLAFTPQAFNGPASDG